MIKTVWGVVYNQLSSISGDRDRYYKVCIKDRSYLIPEREFTSTTLEDLNMAIMSYLRNRKMEGESVARKYEIVKLQVYGSQDSISRCIIKTANGFSCKIGVLTQYIKEELPRIWRE